MYHRAEVVVKIRCKARLRDADFIQFVAANLRDESLPFSASPTTAMASLIVGSMRYPVDDFAAGYDYSSHAMTSNSSPRLDRRSSSAIWRSRVRARQHRQPRTGTRHPWLRGHRRRATPSWRGSTTPPASISTDPGHPELPRDPEHHASAIAAAEVLRRAGRDDRSDVSLTVEKGLPLSGGQGGSAASAIAGAFAVNALLGRPLLANELLLAALVAEERVAGRHLDNLAPALLGGIVLVRSIEPLDVVRLPTPARAAIRRSSIPTCDFAPPTRAPCCPTSVDLPTAMAQAAPSQRWCGPLHRATWRSSAARSTIGSPNRRAPAAPRFRRRQAAAIDAGALGCSIAGGGPSSFAMVDGDDVAERTLAAMLAAYDAAGVSATGRVARVDERGARTRAGPTHDSDPPDVTTSSSRASSASSAATRSASSIPRPACPACGGLLELLHCGRAARSRAPSALRRAPSRDERAGRIGRLAISRARAAVGDQRSDRHRTPRATRPCSTARASPSGPVLSVC